MPQAPGWADWWPLLALVPLGMLLWSLAEYLLHRFVPHGLAPFGLPAVASVVLRLTAG